MEVFIIAVVLMSALVFGVEHKQGDPVLGHAIETDLTKGQSVDRELSPRVCDPGHRHITQRDLTVPLEQQTRHNEH